MDSKVLYSRSVCRLRKVLMEQLNGIAWSNYSRRTPGDWAYCVSSRASAILNTENSERWSLFSPSIVLSESPNYYDLDVISSFNKTKFDVTVKFK